MHTEEQAKVWTWTEAHLKCDLSDFQRKAVDILCRACNLGAYNIPVNWNTVDWDYGPAGVRFKFQREMATFDFDWLANLVILAHDECVRVELRAMAPRVMSITMYQRHKRDGMMNERHPTIEQAIERVRGLAGAPQ